MKAWQQAGGPDPKVKPFGEDPKNAPTCGWGNKPNLRKDPTPAHSWGNRPNPRRSPTSVNVGGRANQERCIPIPRRMGIRPEAIGTWRMNIPMAVGVQQTGDRPVVACTQYSSDDLNIEVTHPSQWKMTKRQQTGNRPMAAGTRRADFSPRAETNLYLKRARKMGKSLITANMQRTNFDLMVVSQRTAMLRVVAEQ